MKLVWLMIPTTVLEVVSSWTTGGAEMKISRTLAIQAEYWLLWLGTTGICWTVCLVFAVFIGQGFAFLIPPSIALVLGLFAGGIFLGLVQLVILQPPAKGDLVWTMVTAAGWSLGLSIFALVLEMAGPMAYGLFAAALGGLLSGAVQSVAMVSNNRVKSAWILVTMLGWIVAMALGLVTSGQGNGQVLTGGLAAILVAWTVGWCILSVVAMVAIVTIIPKPEKRESDVHIRWW